MAALSILIFVCILIIIINANKNNNKDVGYENGNEKKNINIFKFILLCIPVFIAIYMVAGLISMIIMQIMCMQRMTKSLWTVLVTF